MYIRLSKIELRYSLTLYFTIKGFKGDKKLHLLRWGWIVPFIVKNKYNRK
ncbi:hypothetical protein SPV2_gp40 [Sulfolobus polyhedral virus 2]|uniref:Uncharacterized protein n=1 Tax=Sulfolobus polyhedral virus 2 TaxID=2493125 RepID=A0A3S8NFH7_9VIRU|nr:hypothetical protein KM458_gp40 [Sulfolobus polyhedral virus 2]AZI76039.1 hypothetical protein SPV2_gp40 [Sulfolobus polyhedral virus 2]